MMETFSDKDRAFLRTILAEYSENMENVARRSVHSRGENSVIATVARSNAEYADDLRKRI